MRTVQIVSSCLTSTSTAPGKVAAWRLARLFPTLRVSVRIYGPNTAHPWCCHDYLPFLQVTAQTTPQLAPFKPNSFPVIDKLLPINQPVYRD